MDVVGNAVYEIEMGSRCHCTEDNITGWEHSSAVCDAVTHDSGVQAIAALKEAPLLHTLSLNLEANGVGQGRAQVLAALKEAPSLGTLTLDLRDNSLEASDANALASLKEASSLRILTLNMEANVFGEEGAQALAALKDAAALQVLSPNLEANSVGERGPEALAALKAAPFLQTLTLVLGGTAVEDGDTPPACWRSPPGSRGSEPCPSPASVFRHSPVSASLSNRGCRRLPTTPPP